MLKKPIFTSQRYLLLGCLLSCQLSSCTLISKLLPNDQSTNITHNTNQATGEKSGARWATLEREKYIRMAIKAPVLPAEAPISKRLQFWTDAIDTAVRSANPKAFQHIPRPTVLVLNSETVNAYISSLDICFPTKVTLNPLSDTYPTDKVVYISPNDASFDIKDRIEYGTCQLYRRDSADLRDVLAAYNSQVQGSTGCRLNQGEHGISLTGKCQMEGALAKQLQNASYLAYPATASFVHIYSGLIKAFDEESVIAILAHELAHYYGSHVNSPREQATYFYDRQSSRRPGKPPALWRTELLPDFYALSADKTAFPRQVPGSQLYLIGVPGLISTALELWNPYCNNAECTQAIAQLGSYVDQHYSSIMQVVFRYGQTAQSDLQIYIKAEQMVIDALLKIDMQSLINNPEARNQLFTLMAGLGNNDLVEEFKTEFNTAPCINGFVCAQKMEQRFRARETERKNRVARIFDSGFGWYTQEEEADSMSAEYLALLNKDPHIALMPYFGFLELDEKTPGLIIEPPKPFLTYNYANCKALYESKWQKDGKEVMIPFDVNAKEVHHANCYRVYNIDKEIERHGYTIDPTKEVKLPADFPTWAQTVAAIPPPPPTPTRRNSTRVMELLETRNNCIRRKMDCTFLDDYIKY